MPTVDLAESPLAPGISPVRIHYREYGSGRPLVFLHGAWGYGVYPFDKQIKAFQEEFRILIPDRSGYGRSTRVEEEMPLNFHRRAAEETMAFLDALGIERAVLWGHSDGAVIAAMAGLAAPTRCESLILEAFHYLRRKPGSRSFFERFSEHPEDLGEETRKLLAGDHGADDWKRVPRRACSAWIRLAEVARRPDEDLYDGRLSELSVPMLFLHGSEDQRTEPGEMERVRQMLPKAQMRILADAKHCPHNEEAEECNAIGLEFLHSHS